MRVGRAVSSATVSRIQSRDMTAPSITVARRLARQYRSVGGVHRRGHDWVHGVLLPAARKLEQAGPADQRLASRVFRVLGDVHDLNGAPRAAVRSYQRAIKLAPKKPGPWHAMGCMLDNMGLFGRARHALAPPRCRSTGNATRACRAHADNSTRSLGAAWIPRCHSAILSPITTDASSRTTPPSPPRTPESAQKPSSTPQDRRAPL